MNGATSTPAHHQKLAVEHDAAGQPLDHVREASRDVVAGAREEPRFAALVRRLDADAVPFPFGDEVLGVDRGKLLVLDLMRQHQRPERGARPHFGAGGGAGEPGEQRAIGRVHAVPDLLDLGERLPRPFGERGLGEPRRDADPERSGHELEQGPAAGGIEAVEPAREQPRHFGRGAEAERLHHVVELRRFGIAPASRPQQRDGLRGVADIIAGEAEQDRVDTRLDQLAEDAAKRQAEEQSVGECGERPAAVRVRRHGEIVGKQPSLSFRDGV